MPSRLKALFAARCDRCGNKSRECATTFRVLSAITGAVAAEPDTLCADCRRVLNPHFRLHEKHESRRPKIKAKLRDAARMLSGHY